MNKSRSSWELGARSETGYVRSANEDRMGWSRTDYGDVFLVSDGMGGHQGGALAAEITVRTLQEQLAAIPAHSTRFQELVRNAFIAANQNVYSRREPANPETSEMGATGVALVTDGSRFIVSHVGDSRAYLWRRGMLHQLTRDHTRVQTMVDSGLLKPEQAADHPDTSILDRAIGHLPTVQPDVSDWIALEPGDSLLLCSDGLSGYVTDAEIAAILARGATAKSSTDRLIECALAKGGEDNVTVQLARYQPSRTGMWRARLGRHGVAVAASVLLTAIVAVLAAIPMARGYRTRIASLEQQLASAKAVASAPATAPASAPGSVAAASAGSQLVASAQGASAAASKPAAPKTGPAPPARAAKSTHARKGDKAARRGTEPEPAAAAEKPASAADEQALKQASAAATTSTTADPPASAGATNK